MGISVVVSVSVCLAQCSTLVGGLDGEGVVQIYNVGPNNNGGLLATNMVGYANRI